MKRIIIKPVISEKAERLIEKHNQYTFIVAKDANKIEIAKAIEEKYNVSVKAVNTAIMPAKLLRRYTKRGVIRGKKPSFKKAVVTLDANDSIDIYGTE